MQSLFLRLRSLLASTLSASLILLSPGLPAYAAAGKAISVTGLPAGIQGGPTAVPVSIPALNASVIPGSLNLSQTLPGAALPSAAVSASAASAANSLSPKAAAVPLAAGAKASAAATDAKAAAAASAFGSKASVLGALKAAPALRSGVLKDTPSLRLGVAAAAETQGQHESTLQRLAQPLPDFAAQGSESKEIAGADFLNRVGGRTVLSNGVLPVGVASFAAAAAGKSGLSKSKKGKETPESPDELDPQRRGNDGPDGTDGLDDLGNPRRDSGRDDGPDSRDGGSGGGFFAFAAPLTAGLLGSGSLLAMSGGRIQEALLFIPMLLVSLVLHEMAHARAAYKFGDAQPVLEGRTSWKLRDLKSHIDPVWTLLVPIVSFISSGAMFAMANPVRFDSSKFDKPTRDTALVALAGPATNLGLAVIGALAFAGFGALGLPLLAGAAAMFATLNVALTVFNLLPLFPLDGHHILYQLLPYQLSSKLRSFYGRSGFMAYVPLLVFMVAGGSLIVGSIVGMGASLLLGGAAAGVAKMAAAALPVFALGVMLGEKNTRGPTLKAGVPAATVLDGQKPVDYVVVLNSPKKAFAADHHLSWVDEKSRNSVTLYAKTTQAMLTQLEGAGVAAQGLLDRGAAPIASYKRINAVTLRVDASRAPALKQWLESQGHTVYDNSQRRIAPPMPLDPDSADPSARGAVGMAENLKITKTDLVHKIAAQRYGAPDMGLLGRFWRKVTGQQAPQPLIGVIDTGADTTHKQLKRVKATKNATTGPNIDDNGHGSWVTSMVLNYAPWLKSVTHYKTFVDGGATLDDILKALTMSANDGNLVISNSWGSDDGDPKSPDSLLVEKLATEGHIMVFAAGNSGSRPNTIGSPAIVQYKDAKTGAIRVPAVAAADRDKKIAYFSSRGPGSPSTKGDPKLAAHRPDVSALGYNTDGAWPANLGPDKTDPQLGPLKAISGTSMATPAVAGAIALLAMMFGVTTRGDKLDAVVVAVMSTLEKTGQSRDAEGEGFLNLDAAYKALEAQFGAPVSGLRRLLLRFTGEAAFRAIPPAIRAEYYVLMEHRDAYATRHLQLRRHKRSYDNDLDTALDLSFAKDQARLNKLEKAHPQLLKLDSWRGRQWRKLAGE